MAQNTKLELTWIGKYDGHPGVEPRILIENPNYSYGTAEESTLPNGKRWKGNLIIHGDNLLALQSLIQDYAGCVKCIYIDPPYNTGNAFEYYDDGIEHSIWLNLMYSRLKLLHALLAEDGFIFVQIDDQEMAYLSVIMDEIFGRNNRINIITVNMSSLSGVKMTSAINGKRFPKSKEFILLYAKQKGQGVLTIPKIPKGKWDKEYNLIVPQMKPGQFSLFQSMTEKEVNETLATMSLVSLAEYAKNNGIELTEEWKWNNAFRIFGSKSNTALAKYLEDKYYSQQVCCYTNKEGNIRFFRSDYNKNTRDPRVELVQAEANSSVFLSDNWLDISNDGGVGQEGNVHFPNGKKPEKLIQRVIMAGSKPGDIVLDSFLGSGTTAAVAHKMGRKYIGIELGDHAYTHCYPRLKSVVDGSDSSGVSSLEKWSGGGGFRFFELAPSLLKKDSYCHLVINKEYKADMLAAAMAKMEGFVYDPSEDTFWKQGHSSESDYIFTTTQFVTVESLGAILDTMADGESLLVCCKAFQPECKNFSSRISVKKIPSVLLGRCEFDHDDYSLNIIELPQTEEIDDSEDLDNSPETFSDDTSSEPSLF